MAFLGWARLAVLGVIASFALTPAVGAQSSAEEADGEGLPAVLVPFRDFGLAVRDFGEDTWIVVSSPSRVDRRSGAILGGVLAVGGVLFALDKEIQDELDNAPRDGLHGVIRDVGDFVEPVALQSNTNAILAGTAALAYLARQEWLQAPAKQLLYSQWIGGLIRQGSGYLVGRKRPNQVDDAYVFDVGNGTSFPSGHAAVAMEVATVLSHHIGWRPATIGLYALAGAAVFERVDSGAHWASDTWIGAGLGLAVARLVIAAEESRRLSVGPTVGVDGGAGMVVSVRF